MTGRVLLAVLAAALFLPACRKPSPPPVSGDAVADSANQVMFDVHTLMTDQGVQRGELFADTAYVFDDNTRFEFRVVRATFNKASGVQDGVMKAKRGRYDIRNGVLEGYGDVEIVTNDGRKVTSQHLRYNQGRNLVSTDSAYTLREGNRVQRGVGFEADPQLNQFRCFASCGGSAPVDIPES